jgi:hypothetical protein
MTTHAQFYLTRAAVARQLADGSQLDNVKESHLRAAEAWDGFAARAMKADQMRAEEIKRKTPPAEFIASGDDSGPSSEESELHDDPVTAEEEPFLRAF